MVVEVGREGMGVDCLGKCWERWSGNFLPSKVPVSVVVVELSKRKSLVSNKNMGLCLYMKVNNI